MLSKFLHENRCQNSQGIQNREIKRVTFTGNGKRRIQVENFSE